MPLELQQVTRVPLSCCGASLPVAQPAVGQTLCSSDVQAGSLASCNVQVATLVVTWGSNLIAVRVHSLFVVDRLSLVVVCRLFSSCGSGESS